MPRITYIEHNGKSHEINVSNGLTVMEGAVQNNIPGIDADCGGSCACATCHVYVDNSWYIKLDKIDEEEESMLDQAFCVNNNSRLSCQIEFEEKFDGISLALAPE